MHFADRAEADIPNQSRLYAEYWGEMETFKMSVLEDWERLGKPLDWEKWQRQYQSEAFELVKKLNQSKRKQAVARMKSLVSRSNVGFSNPTFWALLQWIPTTGMLKVLSDTSIRPTFATFIEFYLFSSPLKNTPTAQISSYDFKPDGDD